MTLDDENDFKLDAPILLQTVHVQISKSLKHINIYEQIEDRECHTFDKIISSTFCERASFHQRQVSSSCGYETYNSQIYTHVNI
jgi:hypothetical protein